MSYTITMPNLYLIPHLAVYLNDLGFDLVPNLTALPVWEHESNLRICGGHMDGYFTLTASLADESYPTLVALDLPQLEKAFSYISTILGEAKRIAAEKNADILERKRELQELIVTVAEANGWERVSQSADDYGVYHRSEFRMDFDGAFLKIIDSISAKDALTFCPCKSTGDYVVNQRRLSSSYGENDIRFAFAARVSDIKEWPDYVKHQNDTFQEVK